VSRKRSGSWSKWEWAKGHLETLSDELGVSPQSPYGWSESYRATAEAQRSGREYRFYVDAVELDTKDWPLLVGDCLFNLRSALDHLVFELHAKAFRGNVPDPIAEKVARPLPRNGQRSRASDTNSVERSLGFSRTTDGMTNTGSSDEVLAGSARSTTSTNTGTCTSCKQHRKWRE
jgi:hypothetical protein